MRPALLAIAGAVFLVLAIACVNVTNLLLFAGTRRRGELAMRAALGAGRGRIVRQLVTESLLLASAAGALGLGVTAVGVRTLAALAPAGLPRGDAIRLEVPVFVFALVLTTLVGLVVGSWPAIHAARDDLRAGVGSSARTTRGGDHTLRRVLVVAEVALALVLLVGAGLMLRTLQRLFATAPGFDASHVLTMQVQAAGHRYDADEARRLFFEQALDAVRRLPGVTEAAFSSQLPLSGDLDAYGVVFESAARKDPNDYGAALRYAVTPGWFRAMGIPLRSGRLLDVRDLPGAPEAVVINESFARRLFPGRDPIGARVRMGPEIGQAERPWDVVVGVVGDVKQTSLTIGGEDAFYVAMGQWQWVDGVQSLVVRTTGDPAALALPVKRAIWSVDHGQPILRIAPMAQLVATSEAQRRFVLIVFEAFALAAVLLGAVGIYGVLAANVAERRREIGVRAALGAARGDIVALVVRQGLALAGAGAAVGLLGAATASRALDSLLFGVSRLDPATYVAALALLGAVSAAACCVPAWRAARVDPAIALDAE